MNLSNGKALFLGEFQNQGFPGFVADHVIRSRSAISGGYAFESALCLVESQSPLLRPADIRPGEAKVAMAAREARELSSRVLMLTRLLDRVEGQLDSEEAHMLLDAAARVADEFVLVFGPGADSISIDPSATHEQRRAAAKALMSTRSLQDRIRTELDGRDRTLARPISANRRSCSSAPSTSTPLHEIDGAVFQVSTEVSQKIGAAGQIKAGFSAAIAIDPDLKLGIDRRAEAGAQRNASDATFDEEPAPLRPM
jgi:hypothetical protein